MRKTLGLTVALALGITGASVAQSGRAGAPPLTPLKSEEVSAKKLEGFVDCFVQVQTIQQNFSETVGKVQDPEKAKRLQMAAHESILRAIKDEGLTVEGYNLMARSVSESETLRRRFDETVQSKLEEQAQRRKQSGETGPRR